MSIFLEQYKARIAARNHDRREFRKRRHHEFLNNKLMEQQRQLQGQRTQQHNEILKHNRAANLSVLEKLNQLEVNELQARKADNIQGVKMLHDQTWNTQVALLEMLMIELVSFPRRSDFGSLINSFVVNNGDLPITHSLVLSTLNSLKLKKLTQAFCEMSLKYEPATQLNMTDDVFDSKIYCYVYAALLKATINQFPEPGVEPSHISIVLFEFLVGEPDNEAIQVLAEYVFSNGVGLDSGFPQYLNTEEAQFLIFKLYDSLPNDAELAIQFIENCLMTDQYEIGTNFREKAVLTESTNPEIKASLNRLIELASTGN
ncbi:hypothetical protein [Vibrio parahaemolyticus]|uniref:hypothetical protein n=1 Tax=Vibrio parahaemolyticus TaxID=670 RepID=UPI0024BC3B32|nr:hypothetical protein [Vibrio parahaemolyticus]WHT06171.1 hypothetical protein O2T11_24960 [Vibrio parahaemolyticus]